MDNKILNKIFNIVDSNPTVISEITRITISRRAIKKLKKALKKKKHK